MSDRVVYWIYKYEPKVSDSMYIHRREYCKVPDDINRYKHSYSSQIEKIRTILA